MNIKRLLNLLERLLGKSRILKHKSEAAFYCPFCNHYKKKLQININPASSHFGSWHCWVCNARGKNFHTLLSKLKCSKSDHDQLAEIINDTKYFTTITKEEYDTNKKIELPKEFISLYRSPKTPEYRHAIKYLKDRNISIQDVLKYNIGYADSGLYANRIIIPSYDDKGELNYFVARTFFKNNKFKYKNPPISKDIIPFDMHASFDQDLVLVEGVFDAIAIKKNAIPLLGKTIQKSLMHKILIKRPPRIYVCLDNDAIKSAVNITIELNNNGIDARLVQMPDGEDPSSLGFEKTWNIINKTRSADMTKLMILKL